MSIVYTSHYMEEVELLCNRVAIVDQGQIIALDTIKNLIAMLGGGVIQMGLEQVDDDIIDGIRALPSVKSASMMVPTPVTAAEDEEAPVVETPVAPVSDVIKIETKRSQEAMVQLFSFLNERDIDVTSVEILEPNLESVFLHLTGKKLRE
jgi:ABC-2 type transport system ATP-binding protein